MDVKVIVLISLKLGINYDFITGRISLEFMHSHIHTVIHSIYHSLQMEE
jgi:hypothetical protein